MRILIFTDPHVGRRVREAVAAEADVECFFAADAGEARALHVAIAPHLLVLDAERDFPTVAELARAVVREGRARLVFLAPSDPMIAECLDDFSPLGLLNAEFDETALLRLLIKFRRVSRPRHRPSRLFWRSWSEGAGIVCAIAATAVGVRAPALFAALGRLPPEYLAAASLSLLSLSLLIRTQRTVAFAQLCAVSVVTLAPTWR